MKIVLLICLVVLVVALILYLLGASVNREVSDDAGADEGDQLHFNRRARPHPAAD